MIKVNYTYINRIWINTGNKLTSSAKYIIPFGMVNTMKTLLAHRKCLNDFRVIPEKVKEDMKPNKPENFNKTLINVTAEQDVAKGVKEFTYIYCSICQKNELPSLITKFQAKLPGNLDVENNMDNWDSVIIQISYLDLCGCILPNDPSVNAAPNGRRYLTTY